MTEPELLTVENAARTLQVGRSTLYSWINKGLVPIFRVNGVVRVPRTALLRMIETQTRATNEEATGATFSRDDQREASR